MVNRQNKRLGPRGRLIFIAMGVLGVVGSMLTIYVMRSGPTVPGRQGLPAAAAEEAGALPRPAPARR